MSRKRRSWPLVVIETFIFSALAVLAVLWRPGLLEVLAIAGIISLPGVVHVRRDLVTKQLEQSAAWRAIQLGVITLVFAAMAALLSSLVTPRQLLLLQSAITMGEQTRWHPVASRAYSTPATPAHWVVASRKELTGQAQDGRFVVSGSVAAKGRILPPRMVDLYTEMALGEIQHDVAVPLEDIAISLDSGEYLLPVNEKERYRPSHLEHPVPSWIEWTSLGSVTWVSSDTTPWPFALLNSLFFYGAIVPSTVGLLAGLATFLGMRIFLFAFAMQRDPLQTLLLIPYVWSSRQFERSVFAPVEIVPGYPTSALDLPALLRGAWWDRQVFRDTAKLAFLGGALVARLLFKLSMPFLWPIAYLAMPLSAKESSRRRAVQMHYRSRLVPVVIFLSVTSLALFLLKIVALANIAVVLAWLDTHPLTAPVRALDHLTTPLDITLWQVSSAVSAVLFLVAVREVDTLFVRITDGQSLTGPPRFRMGVFGLLLRVRAITTAYTVVCLVVLAIPFLREHFGWLTELVVYRTSQVRS